MLIGNGCVSIISNPNTRHFKRRNLKRIEDGVRSSKGKLRRHTHRAISHHKLGPKDNLSYHDIVLLSMNLTTFGA